MKTKWDSLIQKLDYEYSELMREFKAHEEARNRSDSSLRTLDSEIHEIVSDLASRRSRLAHEIQIAWSFLERLETLKSHCLQDIESTTNLLDRIGGQISLKVKEKKKYEKLAEFAVGHAAMVQVRKEDDETEEILVTRWRSS